MCCVELYCRALHCTEINAPGRSASALASEAARHIQVLKELAETLEEQMRIALRNQNFVNLSECQCYLHMTEDAINALSPKYEGWKGPG